MRRTVIVVDENKYESEELCTILEQENFHTVSLDSLANLAERIQETGCSVVILDLDTLPVDNRFIRNLKLERDKMHIIGLSSRPFHPHLQEAVSTHIYACVGKPVDTDELVYWLKSIDENAQEIKG